MIVTEEQLLSENKYTEKVPQYLRDYEKFFRLIKMFTNYIMLQANAVEEIKSQLMLENAVGNVLEKLASRVGIAIDNKNDPEYYEKLRIAIVGSGIKRNSQASRFMLEEQLGKLFPSISSYILTDYGCLANKASSMQMKLDITGTISAMDSKILENFVVPQITGVGTTINYILFGTDLFAFDKNENAGENNKDYGEKGWDEGEWIKTTSK